MIEKEEILAAIAAARTEVSDRLAALEKRFAAVEGRSVAAEGRLATISSAVTQTAEDVRAFDRKLTRLARELVPATHWAEIGKEDPSPPPNNLVLLPPAREK